jgi:heme exporter protein D
MDWHRWFAYGGLVVLVWVCLGMVVGPVVGKLIKRANEEMERGDGYR